MEAIAAADAIPIPTGLISAKHVPPITAIMQVKRKISTLSTILQWIIVIY